MGVQGREGQGGGGRRQEVRLGRPSQLRKASANGRAQSWMTCVCVRVGVKLGVRSEGNMAWRSRLLDQPIEE